MYYTLEKKSYIFFNKFNICILKCHFICQWIKFENKNCCSDVYLRLKYKFIWHETYWRRRRVSIKTYCDNVFCFYFEMTAKHFRKLFSTYCKVFEMVKIVFKNTKYKMCYIWSCFLSTVVKTKKNIDSFYKFKIRIFYSGKHIIWFQFRICFMFRFC